MTCWVSNVSLAIVTAKDVWFWYPIPVTRTHPRSILHAGCLSHCNSDFICHIIPRHNVNILCVNSFFHGIYQIFNISEIKPKWKTLTASHTILTVLLLLMGMVFQSWLKIVWSFFKRDLTVLMLTLFTVETGLGQRSEFTPWPPFMALWSVR